MKKRDVLFVCQFFYPEYISSATLPFETAKSMVESGLTISALCGYPKEYSISDSVPLKEEKEGVEIKRVRYLQLKRANFVGRLMNYFSFTFAVLLHIGYFRHFSSVIVYSNPPILPVVALLAKKLFGCKIVYVSYDVYPEIAVYTKTIKSKSIITKLMNLINHFGYSSYNKVVALSEDMKVKLLKLRPTLREEKVIVIPNWQNDYELPPYDQSRSNEFFSELGVENKFVVSYFGNMGICQELRTILEGISSLRESNIFFLFAGHGNKMSQLRQIISEHKLRNIAVIEYLQGDSFREALSGSDAYIVSLKDDVTGLAVPSKTYSYLQAGKPILAVMNKDTDIAKDICKYSAGYVIEENDSQSLVDAINDLSTNSGLHSLMSKNSRRIYLDKYTQKKCTKQYVKMIQNVLEE